MKVVPRSEWKERYLEAQAPASVCREGKEKQQCFLTGAHLHLPGEALWGGISGIFWNQPLSSCSGFNVGKTWGQVLALPPPPGL